MAVRDRCHSACRSRLSAQSPGAALASAVMGEAATAHGSAARQSAGVHAEMLRRAAFSSRALVLVGIPAALTLALLLDRAPDAGAGSSTS